MIPIIILAGGKSRRMGRDKLALPFGGPSLLESAVSRFSEVFEDVYISVADAAKYPEITAPRVVDIFPGAGPLSGLHAALSSLPVDGVFLVAADLPFAAPLAARRLIELCCEHDACVIRLADGLLEPLFGFYRRSVLPLCEARLSEGDFRMTRLLEGCITRFVEPAELGELWDDDLIVNVNFPADYERLQGGSK